MMARVEVIAGTHHIYLVLPPDYWNRREAVDDLKTLGARYQPGSGRWALTHAQISGDRLGGWLERHAGDWSYREEGT